MSRLQENTNTQYVQQQENLIHLALRKCDLEDVKKAVQLQKARINERDDKFGWTPLYKAIMQNNEQIVEFLLNNGADPNIKTKLEDSPLHLCIEKNHIQIFKTLLKYKADPNIKGPELFHCTLHALVKSQISQYAYQIQEQKQMIKQQQFHENFIQYKNTLTVHIIQKDGTTPLHIAAESGNIRILKALLERNPKINTLDKTGKTAIDYCIDKNCRELLEEYESNFMNPLNESTINCQEELNSQKSIIDLMENSTKSNFSNRSKKIQTIDTAQFRQNWDIKLKSLKQTINDVKDLKQEVYKTLDEHKIKENQRNHLIQLLKQQDEIQQQQENQQNKYNQNNIQNNYKINNIYDSDKENNSSIVNFIASEDNNHPQYKSNQQQYDSPKLILPTLTDSQENRNDILNTKAQQQDYRLNASNTQIYQRESQTNTQNPYIIQESKTISKWLREINLECLLQNFLDNNVFDNQSLLKFLVNSNNWDKLLITLFGVDKFGHRQRIITKLHEDCGIEKRNGIFSMKYKLGGVQLPTIEAWLQSLRLEQYIDLFILTGFDDLESMMFQMTTEYPITDDILFKEVGICDHNSRKKILDSLSRDSQNAQMAVVPKNFCGGFSLESPGGLGSNQCDNKCSIF